MKSTRELAKIILLFVALVSAACTKKLSSVEYVQEVERNEHLNQTKVFDEIEFKLMYRPDRYYSYKHNKPYKAEEGKKKSYAFVMSVKDLKSHQEVLRRLTSAQEEYGQIVNYLSFEGEKDFWMVQGTDTLKNVFYHFERFNNISPTINFDLGFENNNAGKGDLVVVYDEPLFGVGRIHFTFKKEELDKVDHLVVE